MTNRKFSLGLLVISLVICFMSCGDITQNSAGATFEFRVQYPYMGAWYGGTLTKITFINGSNRDAPVLEVHDVYIEQYEMSDTYKVSGFSNKESTNKYLFGILLTFDDGETMFDWSSEVSGSKVLAIIRAAARWDMDFSLGSW